MTIDELKERLEYYNGKIPVLVSFGQDKNNLTIVRQITGCITYPNSFGFVKEVWLEAWPEVNVHQIGD